MSKLAAYFLFNSTIILILTTSAFAGDLSKCINSYCSYSCNAVTNCGYQSTSATSGCKKTCKPAAKNSLSSVAKSNRLKTCKNTKKEFKGLSCDQIGYLLGFNGGNGGGTKRSYMENPIGICLGSSFTD